MFPGYFLSWAPHITSCCDTCNVIRQGINNFKTIYRAQHLISQTSRLGNQKHQSQLYLAVCCEKSSCQLHFCSRAVLKLFQVQIIMITWDSKNDGIVILEAKKDKFYMLWLCSRRQGEKKITSVVSEMVSLGKGKQRMLGHICGETKIFFLEN